MFSLNFPMIFGRNIDKLLHTKQCRTIFDQVFKKILQMHKQQLNGFLVQCGECQHRTDSNEKSQQMKRAVQRGHWTIWILIQ